MSHAHPHPSTAPSAPRRLLALLAGALLLVTGLVAAQPARAASLTQVGSFGANPAGLNMYSYLPDNLPANAPLVVALHGCTQSAGDYYSHSGWPKYADLWGFAVVFPEQPSSTNPLLDCFDWGTPSDDGRGQGEARSIYQMVQYALTHYGVDPHRIYLTGLSAGGGMTADLLADYPDVFAAGSIDSGPPAQCSTSGISNSNCTSGTTSHTPQQWGDLVRGSDPGYGGPWPRVAIWQGSSDATVNPAHMTASRDQWTNVWGIGQSPSSTQTLPGNTSLSVYDDSAGNPAVETYAISGMAHGLAVHPGSGIDQCGSTGAYYLDSICSSYYTARFFGLDRSTLPAPTGLAVTATTDTTATLSWNSLTGAAGYTVYRNGTRTNTTPVTTTGYTDTGLTPGTTYTYTVAALDSTGATGTTSTAVNATTTAKAPCFTDNNYNQTVAGRAHQIGGYVYANGSDQAMGLWNVYTTHTLKETATNTYVIADGQC
ncbi:extracellular catalytic domain type 1 short-chain-length polyhydroxyalkanoate depolymerase [Kitasatospora nipponensis]